MPKTILIFKKGKVPTIHDIGFLQLLDYESKASEQVELLLKLQENKSALHKAVESGDTDLVYMVVLKLRDTMPLGDFKVL